MVTAGEFRKIYDPSIGESEPWYINDHCFVRGDDGVWHLFGITHPEPANPLDEKFLAHATAADPHGPWTKQPVVLPAEASLGETHVWAPHVIRHRGLYYMFYCAGGASNQSYRIHLAISSDLFAWQRHPANPMLVDGWDARDPMVLRAADEWILYYTATSAPEGGNHVVAAVTSTDLVHWSGKREVFVHPKRGTFGGPTESPFVVARDGHYYLFVCSNEPYDDTAVYESDSPWFFSVERRVGQFPAHAAEVVRHGDEWLVSRCGWGRGGVYLAALSFA
jgi:hypothetical protein